MRSRVWFTTNYTFVHTKCVVCVDRCARRASASQPSVRGGWPGEYCAARRGASKPRRRSTRARARNELRARWRVSVGRWEQGDVGQVTHTHNKHIEIGTNFVPINVLTKSLYWPSCETQRQQMSDGNDTRTHVENGWVNFVHTHTRNTCTSVCSLVISASVLYVNLMYTYACMLSACADDCVRTHRRQYLCRV